MAKKSKPRPVIKAFQHRRVNIKRRTLSLCPEAVELLKSRYVSRYAFAELKKMLPARQIEAAQLMIAMNEFSVGFARLLVSATPCDRLVELKKPKYVARLALKQIARMEQESTNLDHQVCLIAQSYGDDHLDLVVVVGYVLRLLENARVVRFLAQNYSELLSEFQKIAESH
ncbi:plasmid partitioning protein RepB C-terminal domain-containing protein [Rhodoplanes sp. Z2-YC6860]|uniref:plasmid partitioning protein RepB C-terminal domain-containing protein n=1 Tax=Rhodoplanes sp. Z2-YC6860 TaxID=674703 RepID=UPI00078ECDE0|nr:plasmid partitioning protein RepB C-terminal domain-containing protein [Rhodoplanes sp. Z2-YC6860]AMN44114.1 RepB-like nuclease [Rhodoplanes sp. Z2-YC6860]